MVNHNESMDESKLDPGNLHQDPQPDSKKSLFANRYTEKPLIKCVYSEVREAAIKALLWATKKNTFFAESLKRFCKASSANKCANNGVQIVSIILQ